MLKRAEKKMNSNVTFSEDNNSANQSNWHIKDNNIKIICGIILFVILLVAIVGSSVDSAKKSSGTIVSNSPDYLSKKSTTKDYCPNWDWSSSFYDNDCWIDSTCLGSDWFKHSKVINSNCDNWTTPLWWSCELWYSPKSEWNRTQDNDAWYCECDLSKVQCPNYADLKSDSMQKEIDREQDYLDSIYVNRSSQSSIDNYNNYVQKVNNLISKRNRYMSENCSCF